MNALARSLCLCASLVLLASASAAQADAPGGATMSTAFSGGYLLTIDGFAFGVRRGVASLGTAGKMPSLTVTLPVGSTPEFTKLNQLWNDRRNGGHARFPVVAVYQSPQHKADTQTKLHDCVLWGATGKKPGPAGVAEEFTIRCDKQ
jgi:hypothetical protein